MTVAVMPNPDRTLQQRERLQLMASHLQDAAPRTPGGLLPERMISETGDKLPELFSTVNASMLSLLQSARTRDILPPAEMLTAAAATLTSSLPSKGQGIVQTTNHLLSDIVPAVSSSSLSSRYFGFVTGGVTPAARLADYIVTTLDECLAVCLPNDTIASNVENCAISMVSELLHLDQKKPDGSNVWSGHFTSGSSTSNLYGMACGREYVFQARGAPASGAVGIVQIFAAVGVREVQILCSMAHPTVIKAAGLAGLGRAAVKTFGLPNRPWHLDLKAIERELARENVASIVSVGVGEVNSGKVGLTANEFLELRKLCDKYHAWIHCDAAFGVFIRALPDLPVYRHLKDSVKTMHLVADSISGDGHKLLNVPFDCGFFFTRHQGLLKDIFTVPKTDPQFAIPPVYFSRSSPAPAPGPPHPSDIVIQNARRFRALPVYASLTAYGREGYADMLVRQVSLARGIASYLWDHPAYELLPQMPELETKAANLETIFMLVLFRAKDEKLNEVLLKRINETGTLYAQGVVWEGRKAVRCAVASWAVDVKVDLGLVTEALAKAASTPGNARL